MLRPLRDGDVVEQSEAFQDARGIRPQHHPGADFLQPRGPFINGRVDANLCKALPRPPRRCRRQ